ncbi:hypothetical protein OAD42_06505 [Oceanospirillaceae bacterium]|nr:hypothetical protein [Oceanospirillaceae bacterium]
MARLPKKWEVYLPSVTEHLLTLAHLVGTSKIFAPCTYTILVTALLYIWSIDALAIDDVVITSNSHNPHQVLFEAAMLEQSRGHYINAISIYEVIREQEDSARLQLEIAKSYYLAGQLRISRQYFKGILSNAELHTSVANRVRYYLQQIDRRIGSLTMGIDLVSNSNPKNITYEDEVIVLGQKLTIVKSKEMQSSIGINLTLGYEKQLPDLKLGGFPYVTKGYLKSNLVQYQNNINRQVLIDGGFILGLPSLTNASFSVGSAIAFENDVKSYNSYYASVDSSQQLISGFDLSHKLTVSKADINNSSIYDATTTAYEVSIGQRHRLGYTRGIFGFERSAAKAQPFSYIKRRGELQLSDVNIGPIQIFTRVGVVVQQYSTRDPMFGVRRMDGKLWGDVTMNLQDLSIGSFSPQLGFSSEHTLSTINLYAYRSSKVYLKFNYISDSH